MLIKTALNAAIGVLVMMLVPMVGIAGNAASQPSNASVPSKAAKKKLDPFFAIIGDQEIPLETFVAAYREGVRNKFYHGKVARDKLASFKKEVANKLVNQILLTQEAKRRRVSINTAAIDKKLAALDKRNSKKKGWAKNRKKTLAILRERLEREAYVEKFKKVVENVSPPNAKQLRAYYEKNKKVFTEPEQWHVSLILLGVDPSSSSDDWAKTTDQAADLVDQIRNGADFAELARINSSDDSAENGGDMGYLHIGMLSEPAQKVLNLMKPGEISDPVVILKGVAIFRLDGIQPKRLNPLEKVKKRATQLWMRETGEKAWSDLIIKLRGQVKIQYGNTVFDDDEGGKQKNKNG